MKIAFILSAFPELSETWILNQITGLLDAGHDVHIYARANPRKDTVHREVEEYSLMERARYFDIPESMPRRATRGALLAAKNIGPQPRLVLKSISPFHYGRAAFSLSMLYAACSRFEWDFDIIQCHFGPNGLIGQFLRDTGARGKLVVSFHAHDVTSYVRLAGRRVYVKLFRDADVITACSEYTRERTAALGCDPDRITLLPMGFRFDRFHYGERKPPQEGPVKILTVGRLVEKKGHRYAISALSRLAGVYPDFQYLIAGDGPLRGKLERQAAGLPIADRVKFLGEMPHHRILDLYRDAHIFLLPCCTSRNGDTEGQACVLQEAQAAGLPVLSTIHNGVPEGVVEGRSAYLVPERDLEALTDRLSHLLGHPELWPEMGRAGREFVLKKYSSDELNKRLIEIYETALTEK